jgi:nucleotide-binding universal stress UspA family protein
MKTILIATSLSNSDGIIIEKGFQLAEEFSARILILTVIDDTNNFIVPGLTWTLASHWEKDLEYVEDIHDMIKSQYFKKPITTLAVIGNPKSEIIKQAIENNVVFIVIGAHATGSFSTFLSGRTANYVIRRSSVPVVVVPIAGTVPNFLKPV